MVRLFPLSPSFPHADSISLSIVQATQIVQANDKRSGTFTLSSSSPSFPPVLTPPLPASVLDGEGESQKYSFSLFAFC
jgi:hypothetical protein